MLADIEETVFIYCKCSLDRKSFSFLFWTVPLDPETWGFLLISILALIGLLKGAWFEVYAIMMRQDCRILERHKPLVFFILAAVVFTYGYEGVISSFLTIPPPIIIYDTLKELIDQNYKILGFSLDEETSGI